ncbi:MAG: indole-3-glycerol phosphate synthase TrpC [Proteobacteria bacterium]|nr:indole-3-glycerol phosphate synthase TrpC [Pseudomonadota bacterium]
MGTILDKIVEAKKEELKEVKRRNSLPELESLIKVSPDVRNFAAALKGGTADRIRIIAEVKKASPSKGIICKDFVPAVIAEEYQNNGAAAVSVLTETKYFLGSIDYLAEIKERITIPVLRKDFIIDPYQIYEARAFGADAVLLIAGILLKNKLREFLQLSDKLSLFHLVEVRTQEQLVAALEAGAEVIGINNRDLNTFQTDIRVTLELLKEIPKGKTVVTESGISSREDIMRLKLAGVDAFLIGETLMREQSPGLKVRELIGR